MFDSIGWVEIAVILVVVLIVVGPERLPGLIQDVRAAIFAARRAINNAKAEMNGEFGSEFDEFRKPIQQVAQYTAMGPRAAITKALFDGDEEFFDDFDPRKAVRRDAGSGSEVSGSEPNGVEPHGVKPPTVHGGGTFNYADLFSLPEETPEEGKKGPEA